VLLPAVCSPSKGPGRGRARAFGGAFLARLVAGAAAWSPAQWLLQARSAPRINDVTTDTARPPPMVVTQQMRKAAANPAAYPGESAAALQRVAYPDIVPTMLPLAPADAFKRVDQVAVALGRQLRGPEGRSRRGAGAIGRGRRVRARSAHGVPRVLSGFRTAIVLADVARFQKEGANHGPARWTVVITHEG